MQVNYLIKKIIHRLSLYDLYYYFAQSKNKYTYRNKDTKIAYILIEPEYGNLGDQAIALATKLFIRDNFPEYKIVEVSIEDTFKYLRGIVESSNKNDLFLLQGGGNMGNLYPDIEASRRFCIKHIKDRRIISMPTTIAYTDDKKGRKSLISSRKIYSSNPNLILIAREKFSYDIMRKEYPCNKIFLLPDIAFYLSTRIKNIKTERRENIICLRREKESNLSYEERTMLIDNFCSNYPNAFIFDTTVSRTVTAKLRKHEVFSLLHEFQRAKVVLTDRMHGLIFCSITGTPCVVMKSLDNKILGTYDWVKEQKCIVLHETMDIIELLESCEKAQIEKHSELSIDMKEYSKRLKEIIKAQ